MQAMVGDDMALMFYWEQTGYGMDQWSYANAKDGGGVDGGGIGDGDTAEIGHGTLAGGEHCSGNGNGV